MSTAEEPPTLIRAADNGLYIELVFLSNYHSASSYEDSTVRTEYFKFYTPIYADYANNEDVSSPSRQSPRRYQTRIRFVQ